jgi:hypothetical protein
MNNRNWTPFILPATIGGEKTKALTIPEGSPSGENPSRYLQWKVIEANLPEGSNFGDILYWDLSAGDGGAWVILNAPQSSQILIKKFSVCENGEPKEYNMLAWVQN